jgi:hypothetical protein
MLVVIHTEHSSIHFLPLSNEKKTENFTQVQFKNHSSHRTPSKTQMECQIEIDKGNSRELFFIEKIVFSSHFSVSLFFALKNKKV